MRKITKDSREIPKNSQENSKNSREISKNPREFSKERKRQDNPGTKREPILILDDDEKLPIIPTDLLVSKGNDKKKRIVLDTTGHESGLESLDSNNVESTPNFLNKTGKRIKQLHNHESHIGSTSSNNKVRKITKDSREIPKNSRESPKNSREIAKNPREISKERKRQDISVTRREPIVILDDDEKLPIIPTDLSVSKGKDKKKRNVLDTNLSTDSNDLQSTPNFLNNTSKPVDYIVLLYKPNNRKEVLGVGASIVLKQIRLDLNILRSYNNPDIVFLHDEEERKTYMSLDRGSFGQIQVSIFKMKYLYTLKLL